MSRSRLDLKRNLCLDCHQSTKTLSEYYMLEDSVWFQVHDSKVGMLCIGCCEERLGRQLKPEDFKDVYLNDIFFGSKSERLMDRMYARRTHLSCR